MDYHPYDTYFVIVTLMGTLFLILIFSRFSDSNFAQQILLFFVFFFTLVFLEEVIGFAESG